MSMLALSPPFPQQRHGKSDLNPVQAPPKHYFNLSHPEHTSYVNAPTPKPTFHTTLKSSKTLTLRLASAYFKPPPSFTKSSSYTSFTSLNHKTKPREPQQTKNDLCIFGLQPALSNVWPTGTDTTVPTVSCCVLVGSVSCMFH